MQSFGWRAVFSVFLFSHAFVIFLQMFKIIMILPKLNIYSLQKKHRLNVLILSLWIQFVAIIMICFQVRFFFISHRIKTIENKHFKPSSFLFFTYKYLLKIIYSSMHLKWSVSCSTDWIDFFCLNHKDKKVLHTVQRQKRKKNTQHLIFQSIITFVWLKEINKKWS